MEKKTDRLVRIIGFGYVQTDTEICIQLQRRSMG